jgi:hypothetical protein
VVSKVQVYDKKSDQAEFTGIDDGEKTRTINLQLKENKKKGYFGKLDAGGGTDGYYQQQGMINGFKGKRQLAAFGIISNTDKVGLGWEEGNKFGGGPGITEIGDDGSWNIIGSSFDDFSGWSGRYDGDGLPRVWTGGGHYANKWNDVPSAPKTAWGLQTFGEPITMQQAMSIIQGTPNTASLTPAEQAYLSMLDPVAAQAFLKSKGLA